MGLKKKWMLIAGRTVAAEKSMTPFVTRGDAEMRVLAVVSIALVGLGISAIMSIVQGFFGLWSVVLTTQLSTISFATILVLSRFGMHLAARMLLVSFLLVIILFYAWLFGFGIGMGFFLYPLFTLPLVLFGTHEKKYIVASCAMTIAAGIFLELRRDAWQVGQMSLDAAMTYRLRMAYCVTSFVAVMVPPLLLFILTEQFRMQLREEQVQLVQSARLSSLGEMASSIAHEINNPLAIIVGRSSQTARILRASAAPDWETIAKNVHQIEATGHRIAKIIHGLRTFSRDSASDPKAPTSVQSLIDDALGLSQERFRTHGIELRLSNLADEALILCRPTQIVQILVNLLSNAFDAVSGSDDRWVAIDAHTVRESVLITVSDGGPGIPDKIAKKIMEPFFTTKEVGKGTGLGLSLSKGIAEEHGGTLYFERAAGATHFVLSLPQISTNSMQGAA